MGSTCCNKITTLYETNFCPKSQTSWNIKLQLYESYNWPFNTVDWLGMLKEHWSIGRQIYWSPDSQDKPLRISIGQIPLELDLWVFRRQKTSPEVARSPNQRLIRSRARDTTAARARVRIDQLWLAFISHTLRRHRRWLRAFFALTSRPYANNGGQFSQIRSYRSTTHLKWGLFRLLYCVSSCSSI